MAPKRKVIRKTIDNNIKYDLDGPLDDAIEYLQDLKKTYELEGYTDLQIDNYQEYNYGTYDEVITFSGKREETTQEYNKRVAQEKRTREKKKKEREKAAAKEEKKEKELYEKLKKKFEGK